MRKSLRLLLSAGVFALAAGATLAVSAGTADARRDGFHLGILLPPIYLGPPAHYYPPPPPVYYAPPPGYYAPPPCRARYDWRWDGYAWRQAYIGCW